jgi:hypothetical protein
MPWLVWHLVNSVTAVVQTSDVLLAAMLAECVCTMGANAGMYQHSLAGFPFKKNPELAIISLRT